MVRVVVVVVLCFAAAWASSRECDVDAPRPPQIHAFYYLWYGGPRFDGAWRHWNHSVLPHWTAAVRKEWAAVDGSTYDPPDLLHAPFYPQLGPYSSGSPRTLDAHFRMMRAAGIDAAVLSWTGKSGRAVSDTQGVGTDAVFPAAIAAAKRAGVAVAVHLEPYPGRTPASVREDLEDLVDRFGDDLLKMRRPDTCDDLPVVYVYDAYHSAAEDWATLLCDGETTTKGGLRGTAADVVAIGTVLEERELDGLIRRGCFDGLYTYFATDGATYGASTRNWPRLADWASRHRKLFVPSVGPGYNDTRIRPWNRPALRSRAGGAYYETMLRAAIRARPDVISITSFNEWGEGTQIEPAQRPPPKGDGRDHLRATHLDYDGDPDRYLKATHLAKRLWLDPDFPDDPFIISQAKKEL